MTCKPIYDKLWNTYELLKDSFRSSELDIFPIAPWLERLALGLVVAFRRSSQFAAFVPHLEHRRSPEQSHISCDLYTSLAECLLLLNRPVIFQWGWDRRGVSLQLSSPASRKDEDEDEDSQTAKQSRKVFSIWKEDKYMG